MRTINILAYLTVAYIVAPLSSSCQQFQHLFDYDSTYDWGYNIFLNNDSSYFVLGEAEKTNYELINMHLTAHGDSVLSKHSVSSDSASIYCGVVGGAKRLLSGGFISPVTTQFFWGTYRRSWAGIVRYDTAGNLSLARAYTDTSMYFDGMLSCAVTPDGSYLLGGFRSLNSNSNYPALLIRTDSLGDTLWTHTYQKNGSQRTRIVSIIPLNDGRIVIGAISTYPEDAGGIHHTIFNHNLPWFLLLDGLGNIIRDTIYGNKYMTGINVGNLFPDRNGGYINFGFYDSLFSEYPDEIQNFPPYVAHLDSNFRMTWITDIGYTEHYGNRHAGTARQLQDGNIILTGVVGINFGCHTFGWAGKIEEQTGRILWSHIYMSDSTKFAYLFDMVEKQNGNLVLAGSTLNDSLPIWHNDLDIWLISVDSNGCLLPGCDPDTSGGYMDTITAVKNINGEGTSFYVYPNPTEGALIVKTFGRGSFILSTLIGQQLIRYPVEKGTNNFFFPANLAAGMYLGKFIPDEGGQTKEVRIIYQP